MQVYVELDNRAVSETFDAIFRYVDIDATFVMQCAQLYEIYDTVDRNARIYINFSTGPSMCTFYGRCVEKQRGAGMILMEQLTAIEVVSRRMYERDELRIPVHVFPLPEAKLGKPSYERPDSIPDMAELTFDVSESGMCVISNVYLKPENDPYYLTEFAFSEKYHFILPAQLMRRSAHPRTKIGRFDYGFRFVFDSLPDEKKRLSEAIFSTKLSFRG